MKFENLGWPTAYSDRPTDGGAGQRGEALAPIDNYFCKWWFSNEVLVNNSMID
jgi:hypothetical protein